FLARTVLFQAFLTFRFKKVIGTVIVQDSGLPFDQPPACFIQFRLDGIGFVCNDRQGTINLMQFKSRWFEQIGGLLIAGEF
ncbi:hypothetical protein, partial [Dorea sp. 210702-DFI.3.17]|uniref:hypothetical protein n=1 Tax=Dorea sp. 210702-DFI.3.17 TaxID=2883208 RepID=UPI002F3E7CF5